MNNHVITLVTFVTKTGEAETITSHYLFAQGSYRALYIANWIYRYHYENHTDPIAIFAGVIQESFDSSWTIETKDIYQEYLKSGSSRLRKGH